MHKIMSIVLSLTIVLGLMTPVNATETLIINNENEDAIHLEDIVDSENVELEENEDETNEFIDKDTDVNLGGGDKTVDDENTDGEFIDKDEESLDTPSYTIDSDMEKYLEGYLNSLNKEESNKDLEFDSEMEEHLNPLTIDEKLPEEKLQDGIYSANFVAYKTGTESSSSMGKYIDTEKSRIKIKNGKITVQLVINDSTMVVSTKASVNGKEVNTKRIDIDEKSYIAEFKLGSIKDKINIKVDCNYAAIVPSMGIKQHDFDLLISNVTYLEELPEEEELQDGIYSANFAAYKTGTEESSSMGKYIDAEKSKVIIKNDKIKVQLVINDSTMVVSTKASVNGKEVNTKRIDIDEKNYIAEFEIGSIKDKINITVDCNYAAIVPSMGIKQHDFDLVMSDITYVEELPKEEEKPDDNKPEDGDKTLSDGTYTIESEFLKTNSTNASAAGNYLNSKSTLKVKEGKYTLVLNISQYADAFSNLSATVDGVKTNNIDFVKNNDGTGTISFNINSLNSSISVGCTLTIKEINYVNTTDFTVKLDRSTIKDENGDNVEAPEEDIINIKKDAKYSIKNKVVPGVNGTISESARYLDTSSSIEVKYENIFVTLVFNKSDFMDKRTITLNENTSLTPYSVKTENNKTYASFMISSLNDKIHISGKSIKDMDDGFTIVFDNSTLLEVKDQENSGSSDNDDDDKDDDDDDDDDDDEIENGTYTIKNKVLKEDSNSESHAREYVDKESVVTKKNNKLYLTLKFKKASVIKGVSIKVEGKKTSYTTVKKTSDKLYVKFKIDSLSDEILVTTDLDLSNFGISNHDGLAFRVELKPSTLEEDDDADNYDNEKDEDEDEDDKTSTDTIINDSESIKDTNNDLSNIPQINTESQYKKTTYKFNNEIITDSSFGYQAARGAVNKVSYYEIIGDKKYVTLGFGQTDIMNNVRLSINGKKLNYDIISKDDSKKTMDIRFEVPSLSTQVTVTTNVTAMGRDISFGLKFLESTLELISTEEAKKLPNLSNNESEGSESNSSESLLSKITNVLPINNNTSQDKSVVVDEEATKNLASLAKEYFKKYSVTNEIISDSAIGRTMARKYLNQTSIIEDIDGQLYATITFSSSGSMGDFKIEVNGEVIEHTVPLNDMNNELISLRFPINNINDDIKAYIYINPMRMNIDFGIRFFEDSMILLEEGTVGEHKNIESSSLADTLSKVNEKSNNNKEQASAVKIAASTSIMLIVLNQLISALKLAFKRLKTKSVLNKTVEK